MAMLSCNHGSRAVRTRTRSACASAIRQANSRQRGSSSRPMTDVVIRRAREGVDVGRNLRIGEHRQLKPMPARIARRDRLAGGRPRPGALAPARACPCGGHPDSPRGRRTLAGLHCLHHLERDILDRRLLGRLRRLVCGAAQPVGEVRAVALDREQGGVAPRLGA
jgi:hypothetical protein